MLVDLLMLKWIFQSYTKERIIEELISMQVLKRDNDKLLFVNEFKHYFVEGINEVYIKDKELEVIHTIIDILNILLSATVVFFSVNNSEKYLPTWLGWVLGIISLVALYVAHSAIFNLMRFVKLPEVVEEINKVEPKNIIQDENKIEKRLHV